MFVVLLAIALSLIIIYYRRQKSRYEEFWKYIMAIPGPKSVPILGTEYHIKSTEELWLLCRQRSTEFYPIYKIWGFDDAFVVLYSPEDMEVVLSNSKHITKGLVYNFLHDWLGTGLLTSDPKKWHQRRKIVGPAFRFNLLPEFTDVLNTEADYLVQQLKKLCHQPYVDVLGPVADFTLFSLGETFLGISLRGDPNCEVYKKAVHDFGEIFSYRSIHPWMYYDFIYKRSSLYKRSMEITSILHSFSRNVIRKRKKVIDAQGPTKKRMAILDLMLKAKLNGADIDDDGLREETDSFIFAGYDTTSFAISHTLFLLANHPNVQEEMYEEIISVIGPTELPTWADLGELKYMERCIKESLRLFPSAATIDRILGEEVKLKSGYTLPKGCNICLFIYDMHRSPHVWEDPDKFDPDRFLPQNISQKHPYSYLPFSGGIRNCLGQKYAMLEMKTALCAILRNFKLEPYDRMEHIRMKLDVILRPVGELRVILVPRD